MIAAMYRTILVALDGSPREPAVLSAASTLAQRSGAVLHACRAVTRPVGVPDAAWAVPPGDLDRALVEHAAAALAERVAGTAVAEHHVRLGQPADVVLDVAKEIGADLIVIGAHGYGALERLIGSTASKIVHRAECSVLVSRTPAA